MADIRDGAGSTPIREPLAPAGASTLDLERPEGSEIELHDDGTATFRLEGDVEDRDEEHTANLAASLEPGRLAEIARDLLDAIEIDKESRQRRDQQYAEGLRRTGLGDDAPGGAPFNGASRAVHPMLTEAAVDYAARVCSELLPPEGPVKAAVVGTPTDAKVDRAERVARWMNYQWTELMPSAANEMEVGFSQEGLGGAFYVKPVVVNRQPDFEVAHIDMVHRPATDGDFYKQPRITHEMPTDRLTFEENVTAGVWLDVVNTVTSDSTIEQTNASEANDRIIGRDAPMENIDEVRTVYETSMLLRLKGPDDELLPYLVTVDEQSQQILAIYRNWDEGDPNKTRLDYLIEFPFLPWRGGYPIGFAQMIGGLSGAASGALRALLDSALLATMPTGVKLKGGTTAGGQNIRPQPGSTTEVAGSLAQDPDIRKTYMQLEFPQPSAVLFQLLGFLVDAGRGVVRTSFDEFNKMNGEMPVGTANMMIEQGLKTFGSVFARQHRAMRRLLKMLWHINRRTIDNEVVVDKFGELMISREDFEGPMTVSLVSDPRIFTDTQRMASAQLIAARSDAYVQKGLPSPYKIRQIELGVMRAAKVVDPEQYLQDAPEPRQLNAAAENVAVSSGFPVKAFSGQDHEAHIAQHVVYMSSPLFGGNPALAMKILPPLVQHVGEHIALWYADAMTLATNQLLRDTFSDERITVEALQSVSGFEVQLDRLMAEVTPNVMLQAQEVLGPALDAVAKAQELIQKMAPPTPMDPSVVAMMDVRRQEQADKAAAEAKRLEGARKSEETQSRLALEAQDKAADREQADRHHADDVAAKARDAMIDAAGLEVTQRGQDVTVETATLGNDTQLEIAAGNNDTQLTLQEQKSETDLAKADKAAAAAKEAAKLKPKPKPPVQK